NVWNEPWEGMGITGWKSTGEHYRDIIREIKDAVDAADPSIRVIAADSPHNTNWKLFAAGMENVIDAISTHYTPPSVGYSFSLANVYDKEVWETESWLAWKGDAASVRHALYYFAVGGDKVSLYNEQMFFDHHQNPTPTVTWTATMREMLEDLKFEKVVHPGRPPYVLLFVGENRHVAAVTSSLSTGKIPENANFRSQFIGEECTMRIEGEGDYTLYDMLGNPVEKDSGGDLALTVNSEPQYIEFRGGAVEFEKRLANAEYEGLRPVEIFIHDITGRLANGPSIPVELHNAYGVPISGKIRVRAKGLQLPEKSRKFQLKAAESSTVNFSVTGKTTDANQFPVVVEVETDRGSARAEDKVHVSVVAEGSPTVDGNISEWKRFGAIPVVMSGTSTASLQQQAWFPWKKLAESEGKFTAQFAFASDAQNLYMMARVKDTSQNILPSLLNGKNLHNLQNPPYDYTYVSAGPMPGAGGDHIQLALAGADDRPFKPKYELYPPGHPLYRFGAFLNSEYLYMIYPTEGGDAEIMRMRTPDFYYLHPLPIDYEWMGKHCRVAGARVSVRRLEAGYVYEVAIPWEELSALSHGPGDRLRMNVAVQNKGRGNRLTWSADRSAARMNGLDLEPGWGAHWSNDTWWGFEKE
ncbi:MAG: hypothetical protein KGZ25_16380, partial [Planctomycetes bacterium]|nr:hypothetical protein [Planctomycetota bacterium]